MNGGVSVHHVVDGPADGPVVVLSHSLGTALSIWEPQLAALVERYRVVRYDLRGHGRSPVPPGPYDVADLGADLLALLDRLGIEQVVACGTSLGGMVSLWLAANAPSRVAGLVGICTSARLGPPERWLQRAARVRAEGTAAVAADVVARWFTPSTAASRPDLPAAMVELCAATPAEGYAASCEAIARLDLRADLARIACPTLVVMGAEDESIPPIHGQRIVEAVPAARLEVVAGAAHLANVERAEVVGRLLLEHLGAVYGPQAAAAANQEAGR